MKAYTMEQVEKALIRKGFQTNGGNDGIEYFEGRECFNESMVCSHFIYHHENGHSTIMATVDTRFKHGVDFAVINGMNPTEWFNSVKQELS